MKEIPLTQGKVALVDDEDYEWLSGSKWCAWKCGNTFYAKRGVKVENARWTSISMHSIIMKTSVGLEIDHINGDGLDNRKENLRAVTHRQNGQNLHTKRTSQYPGVSWNWRTKKWNVYISLNDRNTYLGTYCDELTAAKRYRIACDWQIAEL